MSELFASGSIVDFILALVALEALAVLAWRHFKGSGPAPLPFISNLLSGTFLMLALRNALSGGGWIFIAICLSLALLAHLANLIFCWEKTASRYIRF